jgi:hypothetical protein
LRGKGRKEKGGGRKGEGQDRTGMENMELTQKTDIANITATQIKI